MTGEVNVKHHIVLHIFELLETFAVFRFIKVNDDIAELRLQFKEQFKGVGRHNLFVELRTIEGCQSAQTSVQSDILKSRKFVKSSYVAVLGLVTMQKVRNLYIHFFLSFIFSRKIKYYDLGQ